MAMTHDPGPALGGMPLEREKARREEENQMRYAGAPARGVKGQRTGSIGVGQLLRGPRRDFFHIMLQLHFQQPRVLQKSRSSRMRRAREKIRTSAVRT